MKNEKDHREKKFQEQNFYRNVAWKEIVSCKLYKKTDNYTNDLCF